MMSWWIREWEGEGVWKGHSTLALRDAVLPAFNLTLHPQPRERCLPRPATEKGPCKVLYQLWAWYLWRLLKQQGYTSIKLKTSKQDCNQHHIKILGHGMTAYSMGGYVVIRFVCPSLLNTQQNVWWSCGVASKEYQCINSYEENNSYLICHVKCWGEIALCHFTLLASFLSLP